MIVVARTGTLLLVVLALSSFGPLRAEDPVEVLYGFVRASEESRTGWLLSRSPDPDSWTMVQYATCELPSDGLRKLEGQFCRVEGNWPDPIFADAPRFRRFDPSRIAVAPEGALLEPIQNDLEDRGVDFHEDGTGWPEGGLTPERVCPDGTAAVPLYLVAPPGADRFVVTAYICHDCDCYWALRTGGFAGVTEWVGSFPLPDAYMTPHSVKPGKVRARKSARKKVLSIRRAKGSPPVYRWETFSPEDIELGQGIRVSKVLRANARRIRVRVEIAAGADPGMRDVSVKGWTAEGLLEVLGRR
jgi:hypothetical protein